MGGSCHFSCYHPYTPNPCLPHESESGHPGVGVSATSTVVDSRSQFIPAEVPRALMSGEKEKPQGRRGKNRNSMDRGKSRQTSQSRKTGALPDKPRLTTAAPGRTGRSELGLSQHPRLLPDRSCSNVQDVTSLPRNSKPPEDPTGPAQVR